MAETTENLIAQLEEILASGVESTAIGDRSIRYRKHSEIQEIISRLKNKASSSQPFQAIYAKSSSGL